MSISSWLPFSHRGQPVWWSLPILNITRYHGKNNAKNHAMAFSALPQSGCINSAHISLWSSNLATLTFKGWVINSYHVPRKRKVRIPVISPTDYHFLLPIPVPARCHQRTQGKTPVHRELQASVQENTGALRQRLRQPSHPCWWHHSTSSRLHPLNSSFTLKPLLKNLGLYYKDLPQLHILCVNLQEGKSPKRDRREAEKSVCFKSLCRWGDQGPWPQTSLHWVPLSKRLDLSLHLPPPKQMPGDKRTH